jgi:transcriptional regulator with XRE-family HTH domain
VSEQWAAVAAAIDQRMVELGILQRDLAERAHVSQAIVRELQHNTAQRRRSARTLEALSTALGWHPRHLHAVLAGEQPPARSESAPLADNEIARQLAAIQSRLRSIEDRLDEVHAYLAKGDINE